MKRVRRQPAWRAALLRRGAGVVSKRAHLPLPLVKRIKAGTAKVSARTEKKLYNAHRQIRYSALRKAGVDPRTARRESAIRNVKRATVRERLIKAGASDANVQAYQDADPALVKELAGRYRKAVKLIWENAKATRPAKDAPKFGEVADGIRRSGRIFAIDDLERYVKPYERGQTVVTPSGGRRRNTWKMIHNIGRYIQEHWEQLSDFDPAYRELYDMARETDVVASSDAKWDDIREHAVDLRQFISDVRGVPWQPPEEPEQENT